jgi:hypothetical protein
MELSFLPQNVWQNEGGELKTSPGTNVNTPCKCTDQLFICFHLGFGYNLEAVNWQIRFR